MLTARKRAIFSTSAYSTLPSRVWVIITKCIISHRVSGQIYENKRDHLLFLQLMSFGFLCVLKLLKKVLDLKIWKDWCKLTKGADRGDFADDKSTAVTLPPARFTNFSFLLDELRQAWTHNPSFATAQQNWNASGRSKQDFSQCEGETTSK